MNSYASNHSHAPIAPRQERNPSTPQPILQSSKRLVRSALVDVPRRAGVLAAIVALNVLLPLRLVGMINERVPFLHSLFVCYPASSRFSKHFLFDFLVERFKWKALLYGVFIQGGKLGFLMFTPTVEREFTRPSNATELEGLQRSIERVRRLLAVSAIHYSGVLPHYVGSHRAIDQSSATIARLLETAYDGLQQDTVAADLPVILLGGLGAIGTQLSARLNRRSIEHYRIDRQPGGDAWPDHLRGKPCVLVDVARKGARRSYQDQFWSEMVYLNETYPEPQGRDLDHMAELGMSVHHVIGVRGKAFPPFPFAYRGGVPCCAMHAENDAELLVRKLA